MRRARTHPVFLVCLAAAFLAGAAGAAEVGKERLGNGITVLTQPAEWNRIVAISVMVDAGSKHDPPKRAGLAYLTNRLLLQGTTTRSAVELAELVDSHGIRIGSEVSEDYSQIHVTAIDSQFDLALEIMADVLMNPAFEEKRLLDAQRGAHDALDARELDPLSSTFAKAGETIFGKHPYANPVQGTTNGIDRVRAKDVIDFHSRRYVGGSTVIGIVGNFSPDHALDRLKELLADYPEGKAPETKFPKVSVGDGKTVTVYKDVELGHVVTGFLVPGAGTSEGTAARVLSVLLGGGSGSRIGAALGDAGAGIADVAGAVCLCREEQSVIVAYASTDDVDQSLELIDAEIERLRTEPVTDEELESAKNRLAGQILVKGQSNIVKASRLASYELAGLGYDYMSSFLRDVDRVDKDDIVNVASRWLEKPVTIIVRPGASATPKRDRPARAGI